MGIGSDQVDVVDQFGDTTAAEVVLFDSELDVAALRPVTAPNPAAPLRSDPANEGDSGVVALVAADGSIEMVDVEVAQRVTILTTDIYRDEQVRRPGLKVTVDIERGDSGAMLHLPDGGVGIVWSRSTETSDQAWTVDLPAELLRPESRIGLLGAVDTGSCV